MAFGSSEPIAFDAVDQCWRLNGTGRHGAPSYSYDRRATDGWRRLPEALTHEPGIRSCLPP